MTRIEIYVDEVWVVGTGCAWPQNAKRSFEAQLHRAKAVVIRASAVVVVRVPRVCTREHCESGATALVKNEGAIGWFDDKRDIEFAAVIPQAVSRVKAALPLR